MGNGRAEGRKGQPDFGKLGVWIGLGVTVVGGFLPVIFPSIPFWLACCLYTAGVFVIVASIWRHAMPQKSLCSRLIATTAVALSLLGLEACGIYKQRQTQSKMAVDASRSTPPNPISETGNAPFSAQSLPVAERSNVAPSVVTPNTREEPRNQINIGRDNNGNIIQGSPNAQIIEAPANKPFISEIRVDVTNELVALEGFPAAYKTVFFLEISNPADRMNISTSKVPASQIGGPKLEKTNTSGTGFGLGFVANFIGIRLIEHTSEKVDPSDFGTISVEIGKSPRSPNAP